MSEVIRTRELKQSTLMDTVARMVAENEFGVVHCSVHKTDVIKLNGKHPKIHPLVGRVQSREHVEKKALPQRGSKRDTCWNKGKKCEYLSKRKGVLSPYWKGGLSPEVELQRKSLEYKQWGRAVYERDKYTCVLCGAYRTATNGVILHADHIKPFASNPESRFDVSNGRILCWTCHKDTHTYSLRVKYQEIEKLNL